MSEIISKTDLVDHVAEIAGITKSQAKNAIDATFDRVEDHVRKGPGSKVRIHNFGTFESKHRPEREAHNPSSGGKVKVPAKNVLAFKPTPALKDL
ncbi:HU family DNA-binding protein [Thioalkalivibrio sp. ALE16]|uniref:HU family DNA-binding protein n=1 Tax=Thioalkalivibrio sp. ALE16 TaxID=1158172 RepID=UPI00036E77BE|nr:HU family DNA-binding protein [Thioalkalivibrio sp. ALE16]